MKKMAIFFGVIVVAIIFNCSRSTGLVYCVVSTDSEYYIGKVLLTNPKQIGKVMRYLECSNQDLKIDSGDGAARGKVRWISCKNGPDCSEAALF